MAPMSGSLRKEGGRAFSRRISLSLVGQSPLPAGAASGVQAARGPEPMNPFSARQIFLFFFLMLGPIKIIGPFARMTQGADTWLAHRIAWRAILFSIFAWLLARHILRFLGVFLQLLGAVPGIIQVALGLQIILTPLQRLWV